MPVRCHRKMKHKTYDFYLVGVPSTIYNSLSQNLALLLISPGRTNNICSIYLFLPLSPVMWSPIAISRHVSHLCIRKLATLSLCKSINTRKTLLILNQFQRIQQTTKCKAAREIWCLLFIHRKTICNKHMHLSGKFGHTLLHKMLY
jgi:hypothetical protein